MNSSKIVEIEVDFKTIQLYSIRDIPVKTLIQHESDLRTLGDVETAFNFIVSCLIDQSQKNIIENLNAEELSSVIAEWTSR